MLEAVAAPCRLGQTEVTVGCSIGVAVFPRDGTTPEDLLRNADAAMYHAKQRGRHTCEFYTSEIGAHVERRAGQQ
jgi:diguanylate cyclase (GGDEF)-like protein